MFIVIYILLSSYYSLIFNVLIISFDLMFYYFILFYFNILILPFIIFNKFNFPYFWNVDIILVFGIITFFSTVKGNRHIMHNLQRKFSKILN